MPFGGHQQIAKGFVSRVPFIHLLPENIYAKLLRISGESEQCVSELLSIKHTQVTIELFERLCAETGMLVAKRRFGSLILTTNKSSDCTRVDCGNGLQH